MRKILFRQEWCIGCRLCEIFCTLAHSKSGDLIKAYKEEKQKPRLKVHLKEEKAAVMICHQCLHPLCVSACPTNALYKNENGLVELDTSRCIGCFGCIPFCHFGAIFPDLEKNIVIKCDLCPQLPVPACVQNCPNKALLLHES